MSGWRTNPAGLSLDGRPAQPGTVTSASPPFSLFVFLCFSCFSWPFLSACSRPAATAATGQVLRISQRNEPATLDPQLASLPDEFFIIRALSEGLLTPDPAGGPPQPAAAARWSVSADGLVYTFELRPDARWSNGEPVTAGDFVYSIRRILSPALAAPKAALFFPLKNAEAVFTGRERNFSAIGAQARDSHRLELTLEHPVADFPAMVASGPWIPVHRGNSEKPGPLDEHGTALTRPENFVGNGPFALTAWHPNQEITVTRNPGYWDAAHVQLQEIRFEAFDNRDSEERAFRAGQVDLTMDVPFSKLEGYRTAQPSVLRTVPLHETRCLILNTTRAPLDDPRVRRALALALDRTALVKQVLHGGQRPALSFIPPGLGGHEPAAQLTENAATARQWLAAAGFPGGRGFPQLELMSWVNSPLLEAIQQMWRRELGIEITLAQHEARTHLAALAAGDYTVALAPAIPDYGGASDLLTRLQTGNPANYPRWSNAEFDRLVTAGSRAGSTAERQAAYQQAEAVLLQDMPLIPLYFNAQNFLIRPTVQGWQEDALWTRFYQNIHLDEK